MKKTLIALTAVVSMAMPAYAATTQTVNVTASVGQVLDLTMVVNERAAITDLPIPAPVTTIAFGQLTDNTFGALTGQKNYAVFLGANSSSRPYRITSTMPALSTGTGSTLPPAMGMNFISAKSANADIAGDVHPLTMTNAIKNNEVIYTSNSAGTGASIELWYGLVGYAAGGASPFTGFQPVLPDQAAGAYSTTMQYTIALI